MPPPQRDSSDSFTLKEKPCPEERGSSNISDSRLYITEHFIGPGLIVPRIVIDPDSLETGIEPPVGHLPSGDFAHLRSPDHRCPNRSEPASAPWGRKMTRPDRGGLRLDRLIRTE